MGPTVATLLKLVKQFDDFVAPAATRVLCSLLPEDDLRQTMLHFGALSTFLDMLDRCSDETKQITCHALVEFAQYDDVRHMLSQDGYLQKLAKRIQSHVLSKCDGAIVALVALGYTQARPSVTEAIQAAKTIEVLVARLNQKSTALSAASALGRLARIDDVAVILSDDKSGACVGIVSMLQRRWFDGLRGEDGLQVLSKLLECERFKSAVLKAGAIDVLYTMVGSGHYGSTYAGLHYLRIIARFDEGGSALPSHETLRLVPQVVSALRVPYRRVQRVAMETLRLLFAQEDLRVPIVDGLLALLKDRHAGVLFATSTVLGFLASERSVRDRVLTEETFWNLSHEYYDVLSLEYDEKGRGEVYESVGRMIKLMQVPDRDESGALKVEDHGEEEKRWPIRVSYELEKENRPADLPRSMAGGVTSIAGRDCVTVESVVGRAIRGDSGERIFLRIMVIMLRRVVLALLFAWK
ncbi:armadillo-type protein [Boletus edulis]|nr:armadillo-type protein [Boletus edulis]